MRRGSSVLPEKRSSLPRLSPRVERTAGAARYSLVPRREHVVCLRDLAVGDATTLRPAAASGTRNHRDISRPCCEPWKTVCAASDAEQSLLWREDDGLYATNAER